MPTQVYTRKANGPSTYALVIAVGHYPHLPGGSSRTKFQNHEGMGQLNSPPESARRFARWLIENYECPSCPLAGVSLLISEKKPAAFSFRKDGKPKTVEVSPATMEKIRAAIFDWRQKGDGNPDNTLLFYFCGHGITAGTEIALLAADFGAEPLAPLSGALDFRRFHAAMDECSARQQVYFVDACRVGSELLKNNPNYAGDPVLNWTGTVVNPGGRLRLGPIFYSTLAGAPAYAKPREPSLFTQALLESLAGAGSGDETGEWQVKTTRLQESLDFLMREASRDLEMPQAQIASSDSFASLTLNSVAVPEVPVIVRVDPQKAHEQATLRCEGEAVKEKRPPKPVPWRLRLPTGRYNFFADFKAGAFTASPKLDEIIRPPFWGKPLKAQP